MNNFDYQNPVRVVFGKGTIAKLGELIESDKKVLITYGGGSIKKNGVYEQVTAALKKHTVVEFGGIEPNPTYETCMQAVALAKLKRWTFCLVSVAARYWTGRSLSPRRPNSTAIRGMFCPNPRR